MTAPYFSGLLDAARIDTPHYTYALLPATGLLVASSESAYARDVQQYAHDCTWTITPLLTQPTDIDRLRADLQAMRRFWGEADRSATRLESVPGDTLDDRLARRPALQWDPYPDVGVDMAPSEIAAWRKGQTHE